MHDSSLFEPSGFEGFYDTNRVVLQNRCKKKFKEQPQPLIGDYLADTSSGKKLLLFLYMVTTSNIKTQLDSEHLFNESETSRQCCRKLSPYTGSFFRGARAKCSSRTSLNLVTVTGTYTLFVGTSKKERLQRNNQCTQQAVLPQFYREIFNRGSAIGS